MVSEVARYEWAFAYHWHHWSPYVQWIYTACGIACGYLYYNRKKTTTLSCGETLAYDFKAKSPKLAVRIVDVVFMVKNHMTWLPLAALFFVYGDMRYRQKQDAPPKRASGSR